MGKTYPSIDAPIRAWIGRQKVFFVATAPLGRDGMVNCSPKGLDTLRIVDDRTLAYLDFGGSGVETIAHLKENGRIVVMMCAFDGPPKIFRFHGRGEVVAANHDDFGGLYDLFEKTALVPRAIIRIHVERISDSCGFGVPLYDFVADRDASYKYLDGVSQEDVTEYLLQNNQASLDGLAGLTPEEIKARPPRPTAKAAG